MPSASSTVTSGVIDALLFSQEDEGGFEMFLLRVVSCLGGWLYFWGGEAIEVRNQRGKVTNKNLQGENLWIPGARQHLANLWDRPLYPNSPFKLGGVLNTFRGGPKFCLVTYSKRRPLSRSVLVAFNQWQKPCVSKSIFTCLVAQKGGQTQIRAWILTERHDFDTFCCWKIPGRNRFLETETRYASSKTTMRWAQFYTSFHTEVFTSSWWTWMGVQWWEPGNFTLNTRTSTVVHSAWFCLHSHQKLV